MGLHLFLFGEEKKVPKKRNLRKKKGQFHGTAFLLKVLLDTFSFKKRCPLY